MHIDASTGPMQYPQLPPQVYLLHNIHPSSTPPLHYGQHYYPLAMFYAEGSHDDSSINPTLRYPAPAPALPSTASLPSTSPLPFVGPLPFTVLLPSAAPYNQSLQIHLPGLPTSDDDMDMDMDIEF
ncbi:hypothetical protein BDR06DRAFT_1001503 [Suillus hirtellus]|nr:hypothetical protein BDR06DRAFT_1001503 [Suillus hirtellus]